MKTIMHIAQAPGGVERYLSALLSNMDKTEYCNILVCSQSYDYGKFKDLAAHIEIVEMYREINLINDVKAVVRIRNIIKKYRPDIIYMHSSKAGVVGRIANLGIRNISLYNAHGWAFNMNCDRKKKLIYIWVERILAPLCMAIIAISDYEKKSAVERKICNPDKIHVIFNGIDFKEYENIHQIKRKELGIPDEAFVVGTVGRLTAQKAPDTFVKAAKVIKARIPDAFFMMVGDGDLQEETERLIDKCGLKDCFIITGWVDNPIDYIDIFDVATLLSRWEGFGLVLAEYMLSEKPIVATRVDAIPDIISDGLNGLFVDVDDYINVADKVVEIFEDDDLRKMLIRNGVKEVKQRFNVRRVIEEHHLLVTSLLK